MPPAAVYVLIMSLAVGVLLTAVGTPLALRRVGPNRHYGFRVGRAVEDERAWYDANSACGRWLAIAGGAVVLCAVINAALGTLAGVAVLINGVVMTLGIIVAIGAGFAAMHTDDFPPRDGRSS